jgi:flagellar biosynthesis/type III secretory pathway M-ring protein FliF/YscJ
MKTRISAVLSWNDVEQVRTEATQEEMKGSKKEMKSVTGVLGCRMHFVQAKTAMYQDETTTAIRSSQEKTESALNSIRTELDETKHRVEGVSVSVDLSTDGLWASAKNSMGR